MEHPELYQRVVLLRDIPSEFMLTGDVAWFIDTVEHPHDGELGAILEVFNIVGESVRVVIVPISAIDVLREEYLPTVRLNAATHA